jgi:hypothetical protein
MRCVRVRMPATISAVGVRTLLHTAAEANGFDPGPLLDEVTAGIAAGHLGVFVGYDDATAPVAIAIGMLPTSAFMMGPQVLLAYSEDAEVFRLVGERMRAWMRDAGHDRAFAINHLHADAPFMRVTSHFGKPGRMGSVIEFDLTDQM